MGRFARFGAAILAISFSTATAAQAQGPAYDCGPTETEEACRARLGCLPGETMEGCKLRKKAEWDNRDKDPDEDPKDDKKQEDPKPPNPNETDEERKEREEKERERREEREEKERERREEREEREERKRDRDSGGSSSASEVLAPGTRPWFFAGAVGPNFFGLNRSTIGFSRARARVALDFGYHFSGNFEGPAIGGTVEQTFSDGDTFYVINPAFKFWYDIQPSDSYGIYITPFAKAGYAGALCSRRFDCPHHAFNIGFGVAGRLILNDRGLLLLRPVQLDTYLGDFFNETFWLNYSVLIGGGVIWD